MSNKQDTIIEQLRQFKNKHNKTEIFTGNIPNNHLRELRTVAEAFVKNKIINPDSLENTSNSSDTYYEYIIYMVAAKRVGYTKLYNDLNEYTHGILDSFCSNIEVTDDCNDDFTTAIARHVYAMNPNVYEYLDKNHIRYLDAGIINQHNNQIFLPAYTALIRVPKYHDNNDGYDCINEINNIIKSSSKSDMSSYNDSEISFTKESIKTFIYLNGELRVTTEDSDPLNIDKDFYITEYIVDIETDTDAINDSMFRANLNEAKSKTGSIKTSRAIPISKLHEGDILSVKGGIVYHDNFHKCYKIVGNFELIHFIKYTNLNSLYLVFSHKTNKKLLIDKYNLGDLNKVELDIEFNNWSYDYGKDKLKENLMYLYKNKTKVGERQFRETIDFTDIQKLLDDFNS